MARKLKVTLVRSLIGRPEKQRRTAQALGLRKLHSHAIKDDTPSIRGMIRKLEHLVSVEEIDVQEG
ncbi:50S ribosomal protein L30 [Calderihabitans maritimus]|uniref:Large ribosomal subunit protein uL30 n=1 Tax=Calderihabitans maritimus TaxID=1246530 RepID=A0A1Z5HMZ0_9FIRM|nr:50S ribosomal protein L30 [Calderihabitans maritimus]